MLRHAIPILLLFMLLQTLHREAAAQPAPTEAQLLYFYRQKLNAPFYGARMDGITGLAHLGPAAARAASELIDIAESPSESPFYRLLACWALAGIGTPEARRLVRQRIPAEAREDPSGNIHMVAARAVFLAAAGVYAPTLDRYLPALYNHARSGDPSEQILAAWALIEIGTAVTKETADRALTEVSKSLDPSGGNFTRHLRYLRLLERPSAAAVVPSLERLVADRSFAISLVRKQSLAAYTLAAVTYPDLTATMDDFLGMIGKKLENVLDRSSALRDVLNLGPFACSGSIEPRLQSIVREAGDEEDRKSAARALRFCRE